MRWRAGVLALGLVTVSVASSIFPGLWPRLLPSMTAASDQGPVVARVYFPDRATLDRLASHLDVWEVQQRQGYLLALLSPEERANLERQGLSVKVDQARSAALGPKAEALPGQAAGIPGFPCYRTVEETHQSLRALAMKNSHLAVWKSIGSSWEATTPGGRPGHQLHVLVLTNRAAAAPKPVLFLMAEIHAREYATAELAARFAEHLVAAYGSDPDATWLLDYNEVHILPLSNPDGREWAEQGYLWRKNTDSDDGCESFPSYGTDLNRNFSDHWAAAGSTDDPCSEVYHGSAAASEPETQAIQAYVASLFPDQRGPGDADAAPDDATGLLISLHSYGNWVLFPWGWTRSPAPNHTELQTLGRKLGYLNGYQVCRAGDCLYLAAGATDDWAYGQLGVAAYTFEVGDSFFQNCSSFETSIVPTNVASLLYALKAAHWPYQAPKGPDSLEVTLSANLVPLGATATLTSVADDTRYASGGYGDEPVQHVAAARYTLDAPSWMAGTVSQPLSAADGAFDEPIEELTGVVSTTGLAPGRHLVLVEAQDSDGNWGPPSAVFLYVDQSVRDLFVPMVRK